MADKLLVFIAIYLVFFTYLTGIFNLCVIRNE